MNNNIKELLEEYKSQINDEGGNETAYCFGTASDEAFECCQLCCGLGMVEICCPMCMGY